MDTLKDIKNKIQSIIGIPRYKKEIQDIQSLYLAPYATKTPKENSRLWKNIGSNMETRSEFQRDRDRIIHSKAFRRLLYKTQVFVNHEGDHYRTRMTHSLEVSQISRGIARSLGANEDLTEAIALGHDLGHTPFGHAVEDLLSQFLNGESGFYHNIQSVRIVDVLEKKEGFTEGTGLNLTWEVREGILKHTRDRMQGIYESLQPEMPGSLESQIVALSDTVAYVCHDLDDGISAGLIDDKIKHSLLEGDILDRYWSMFDADRNYGVSSIINRLVSDIVETSWDIIYTNNIYSPDRVRAFTDSSNDNNIIRLGKYAGGFKKLKAFVGENIYNSPMTTIMDVKAQKFVAEIYDTYWKNPQQLPNEYYKKFTNAQNHGGAHETHGINGYDGYKTTPARVLCDYISEMTDRYALETYERLFGPFTKI